METNSVSDTLKSTPLTELHTELGAKLVPFAGYNMPVSYPLGVMKEHLHTREKAGLFDVSHMGQAYLVGPDHDTVAAAIEAMVPGSVRELAPGRVRYTVLLNDDGGVIDDLMITRSLAPEDDGRLYVVVNASRKDVDYAYIKGRLPDSVRLETIDDHALIAIQGPAAAAVMGELCDVAGELGFMAARSVEIAGFECHISRSGYTGEDGYEISVPQVHADGLARRLLENDNAAFIGLGARDSLRLEAGLCLYGQELDESISPVEAGLSWIIGKRRRADGGFAGAERILRELADGPSRIRVGLKPVGRAPAREGTEIVDMAGVLVGRVTSGGFGPTVQGPISMGYVQAEYGTVGAELGLMVRSKQLPAHVAALPFAPHRFYRG